MKYIAFIDGGQVPGTKHTTIDGIILKDGITLTFDLIPRENNKLADTLCRKARKLVNKKDINT